MYTILLWAVLATFVVSLISLVGIFFLALKEKALNSILLILIGFSAGALIGAAFLHLLPEALTGLKSGTICLYVLIGFTVFFIIEKFLKWRHCHKGKCDIHTFTYMNLVGDAVHNFTDGLIIVASFFVNISFGIVTTIAIIAHEVPQEIGDFGVLIYGGFTKRKALFFNFLSALFAIAGAVVGYFLATQIEQIVPFLLPFAAGGFIYIAASDLVPELHKELEMKKSLGSFAFFILGILFMWLIKFLL